MFDLRRTNAAVRAGLIDGIPEMRHPSDGLLISTVVAHGMPRWSAEQMRGHAGLRLAFARFWADVHAAAGGDTEARERVDVCRAGWDEMRKHEVISDHPDMSVGMWER